MDFKDLQGQKTVPEAFMEQLKDYEAMKPNLIMEMVGKEAHADCLQNVPHTDMEDMAVTYRFLLDRTEEGQATIPLTNNCLITMESPQSIFIRMQWKVLSK